jgi:hypothetical protein
MDSRRIYAVMPWFSAWVVWGTLFAIVNDVHGSSGLLESFAVSALPCCAIALLLSVNKRVRRVGEARERFLWAADLALAYSKAGIGVCNALAISGHASQEDMTAKGLERIRILLLCGEKAEIGGNNTAIPLSADGSCRVIGDAESLEAAVAGYYSLEKEEGAKKWDNIVKLSTLSMFFSAVGPSFVIFAFVGESIVGGRGSILPFSLIMLGVMPVAYAAVKAKMERVFL